MCYNLIEVTNMEKPFRLLEQTKTLLLQEKLSRLAPYGKAKRDSETIWTQFQDTHPEPVVEEVLDLLDCRDRAASWRLDAAFCLGLRLGMELGRLDEFWDSEA